MTSIDFSRKHFLAPGRTERFTAANGFTSLANAKPMYRSFLYGRGFRHAQVAFVNGERHGLHFESYTHQFRVSAQTFSETVSVRVIAIDLGKAFPHLFIDSRKNGKGMKGGIWSLYDSAQRLDLEGTFSDHFDVYIPKEYEIEGLDVFSVDLMAVMQDSLVQFDIEVIDQKLVVYFPVRKTTPLRNVVMAQFSILEALLPLLSKKIAVWQFSEIPKTSPILEDDYDEQIQSAHRLASFVGVVLWIVLIAVVLLVIAVFAVLFVSPESLS